MIYTCGAVKMWEQKSITDVDFKGPVFMSRCVRSHSLPCIHASGLVFFARQYQNEYIQNSLLVLGANIAMRIDFLLIIIDDNLRIIIISLSLTR